MNYEDKITDVNLVNQEIQKNEETLLIETDKLRKKLILEQSAKNKFEEKFNEIQKKNENLKEKNQ